MKRIPTTVGHIRNRFRVKAAKCKSCRIDAPIRQKPLRSVMSYPDSKMVSIENTGLPLKLHTTGATRQLAPQGSVNLMGMMASLPAQRRLPCTHWTEGWVGLMAVWVFWKTHKSPYTGNLLARSQSLYLLSYASTHSSLERSYYQSTSSPIGNLL